MRFTLFTREELNELDRILRKQLPEFKKNLYRFLAEKEKKEERELNERAKRHTKVFYVERCGEESWRKNKPPF